jgi:glyoxylase-like metal-dependent hydrolase (beta-lactamase superfamily II)
MNAVFGEQAPGYYRYRVGDIEITAVNDGFARRPLEGFIQNAELSDVQEAMRSRFHSTQTLDVPFTPLVLRIRDRVILIDAGNGNSGAPTSGTWMSNFRAAGFTPEMVDTVVITHFHPDHINGLRLADGTDMFAQAEIMVPAAEWDFWMDDGKMSSAPERMLPAFKNSRRVFNGMEKRIARFEAEREVIPGVTAIAAYGHSPGHTVFRIASGDEGLMMMSDTTNHPVLFARNPDWSAVFDNDPDQARQTRRRLLDQVASERVRVAFYHAPFPATGHIMRDGNGFDFVPTQWTPEV